MPKEMRFDHDARTAVFEGVKKVARAVKSTLGPTGRNVVIKNEGRPAVITKDGVTVAKAVSLEDPFENLGAELLISVAAKTADVAGDGTTTATVIAEAILEAGARQLSSGAKAVDLKHGIDKAVKEVLTLLDAMSVAVESEKQMGQVASISANNDTEIGTLLAGVIAKVGAEGVVTVEESSGVETLVETVEGLEFDRGYTTPYFITDPNTGESSWEKPYVLVHSGKISAVKDIATGNGKGLIDRVVTSGKPFVIIADAVDGDALTLICMNRAQRGIPVSIVAAPGFGDSRKEMLADIAAVLGTTVFSKDAGDKLNGIELDALGTAERIVSTKDKTRIVGGGGESEIIQSRINAIQHKIDSATGEGEKRALKERMAKLSNGIAVVRVGGTSEIEMREKKDRIEDALYATQAAVESGVVPGGGVALVRCIAGIERLAASLNGDEAAGARIIMFALAVPLKQIANNAGQPGDSVLEKVLQGELDYGYNARTNKYEKLLKAGVLDPTKVTKAALQNAASVAGLMLTTDALLVEIPKKES